MSTTGRTFQFSTHWHDSGFILLAGAGCCPARAMNEKEFQAQSVEEVGVGLRCVGCFLPILVDSFVVMLLQHFEESVESSGEKDFFGESECATLRRRSKHVSRRHCLIFVAIPFPLGPFEAPRSSDTSSSRYPVRSRDSRVPDHCFTSGG